MTRMGEKGSVVSFILVGGLLAALVVGGLYVLKERSFFGIGEQGETVVSDNNDQATEGDKQDSQDDSEPSSGDTSSGQDSASTDNSASDEGDATSSAGDDSDSEPSEQADIEDSTVVASSNDDSSSTDSSSTAASELPETGPADALLVLLGPAVLVGAFLAYRRSYQL